MKIYKMPDVEVMTIKVDDILTTSGGDYTPIVPITPGGDTGTGTSNPGENRTPIV